MLAGDDEEDNDPVFSGDALWGAGPEAVSFERAGDGVYQLFAANMCDRPFEDGRYGASGGAATATIRIWENGRKAFEGTQTLARGERWHAASVAIASAGASVVVTAGDAALGDAGPDVCPAAP